MGGFLIAAIIIASGIIGSAFSKILADEFKAWRPSIVNRLIGIAASLLSDIDRDRYHEEWIAYVEEVPGDLGKLISASGFVWAAFRMSDRKFITLGAKRVMDIGMAASSLLLLSLPLILVALAIKIESPGPILFAQRRIGKDGKEFLLYRFRAFHLATEDQPARVTRIGRLIRLSSLDELPQIYNVLRGDMSIVGPRSLSSNIPMDDETVQMLKLRQSMRPGLTGLGQVLRPSSDGRTRNVLLSDLLYVLEHSITLDIGILVKTAISVLAENKRSLSPGGLCALLALLLPTAFTIWMLIVAVIH